MGSPTLSVVIPTFNRRELVVQSIESVLAAQGDVEIVVVDDGSSDGTAELLGALYGDRIRLLVQTNKGRSCARNAGVVVAEGDYVCFLDSDDLWEPWHVAQFRQAFAASGPTAYSAAVLLWDPATSHVAEVPRGVPIPTKSFRESTLVGTLCPLQGLFVPRAVCAETGFDEGLEGSEDWVFLALLSRKIEIAFLVRPSVRIRVHSGRSMSNVDWDVRWRRRAAERLGQQLRGATTRDRQLIQAGTARYCAARLYEVGRMREARSELLAVRAGLGMFIGWRSTWRLWLLTVLRPLLSAVRLSRTPPGGAG